MTDLDEISSWLEKMGIRSTEKKSSDTLKVVLRTTSAKLQYSLFFHREKDDFRFESFVFKSVSGNPEKVATFYETVLGYNDYTRPLSFALASVENGWRITLGGSQECSLFNPYFLERILNLYNEFYVTHYAILSELANELGLKFSGETSGPLKSLLNALLNDDL